MRSNDSIRWNISSECSIHNFVWIYFILIIAIFVSIFQLSHLLLRFWLVLMLFLWKAAFILLIVIIYFRNNPTIRVRIRINTVEFVHNSCSQNIIMLSLWLCKIFGNHFAKPPIYVNWEHLKFQACGPCWCIKLAHFIRHWNRSGEFPNLCDNLPN